MEIFRCKKCNKIRVNPQIYIKYDGYLCKRCKNEIEEYEAKERNAHLLSFDFRIENYPDDFENRESIFEYEEINIELDGLNMSLYGK